MLSLSKWLAALKCNLLCNIALLLYILGESLQIKDTIKFPERRNCTRCGFVSSQEICKACVLLEGLNRGLPKLGIGKSNKAKQIMGFAPNVRKEANQNKKLEF